MAISDYLNKLVQLKNELITTLRNKGVEVSDDEKLNTLVPKVEEVEGESDFEIVDMPIDTFAGKYSYLLPGIAKMIESFKVPDGSTKIPTYAFYYATNLKEVTIPDSVTNIEADAFRSSGLLSVIIPDSVTSIGDAAFSHCSSLLNAIIGNGVKSIGGQAFWYCSNLKEVIIGNGVTQIPAQAFYKCTNLTSITISDSITSIDSSAFTDCPISELKISEGSKAIKALMVIDNTTLKTVVIPSSVTSIEAETFLDCTVLEKVYISDIGAWCGIEFANLRANPTTYAKALYLNNELVTELIIPDDVTYIGNYAFSCCYDITNITIGNGVTSIGEYAFDNCTNLESVIIGNGITSIGQGTFYKCNNLANIYYTGTQAEWDAITKGANWNYKMGSSVEGGTVIHYNYVPE